MRRSCWWPAPWRAARSLAAVVKGFAEFEPGVRMAGVVANQAGSPRHKAWLAEALAAASLPPLLGTVPRGALPSLQSRHLGLVAADPATLDDQTFEALADACAKHVDLKALEELAGARRREHCWTSQQWHPCQRSVVAACESASHGTRHFTSTIPTIWKRSNLPGPSSCRSRRWPTARCRRISLDCISAAAIPEEHAERLSANAALREAVGRFAASGRCVHAECGGLMYLGRALRRADGRRFPMAGVLPVETAMCGSVKSLGYVEVAFAGDSLWGPAGAVCRGHEFHYSEIVADDTAAAGWQPAYAVRRRRSEVVAAEGFSQGNVLAGYVHLHWASRPWAVAHFLARCAGCIMERERVK